MSREMIFMYSWLARVLERVTLSLIVIIISTVIIIAFWKSLQKIDFDLSNKDANVRASIVLGTPIFVLLILVGFSFVSFSHPISLQLGHEDTNKKKNQAVDQTSFFGSADEKNFIGMIRNIKKANEKLYNYNKNKDGTFNLDFVEISGVLKDVTTDLVNATYGRDIVSNCKNKNAPEYNNSECKDIREFIQ